MNKVVLQINELTKLFPVKKGLFRYADPFVAVDNLSFSLHEGEILGFLGHNGAGKTTTIQMLLGLMTPTSGSIEYFGKDFFKHQSDILQQVSFASAYAKLTGRLTIYENLYFFARLYGLSYRESVEQINYYLQLLQIDDIQDRMTGVLSAGQTTRVLLAKAFISKPKILLLDEPTASLDPDAAQIIRRFILEQRKKEKIAVLFTSHNMTEVEELCDRVLILKRGSIIADNTPEEIARQISQTTIHLMIEEKDVPQLQQLFDNQSIQYELEKPYIIFSVHEANIAKTLMLLAQHTIMYSQIYIDKPTLEDYFLQKAK